MVARISLPDCSEYLDHHTLGGDHHACRRFFGRDYGCHSALVDGHSHKAAFKRRTLDRNQALLLFDAHVGFCLDVFSEYLLFDVGVVLA